MKSSIAAVVLLAACAPRTATTDQDLVMVFPIAHDFGTVQIGSQSATFPITVDPASGANDDLVTAVTADCPGFVITATNLPAEVFRTCLPICAGNCYDFSSCQTDESQSYTFEAYFRPIVPQQTTCVVTITLNNTTNRPVSLTGTGMQPPVDIDVTPTSIAFGDVRRATTSTPVGLVVKNLGGLAMTVSSVTASAGYTILSGPPGPYAVPPGGSQPYSLACAPPGLGAMPGSVVITSDDPSTPTTTIPLSCNGIDSTIDLVPSPAVLATTRVGEPTKTKIAITNSGAAPSTLQSVVVTGDMTLVSGPAAGTVLAPSTSAEVAIVFPALAKGPASGTLEVTYDGGLVRTAQITADAVATSMSLAPDGEVDFGPVCVGQAAVTAFSIVAADQGPFEVQHISSPASPFTSTLPALPVNLAGNGAETLAFTIAAAPTEEGEATDTFTVDTDIPGATPHTVTLLVTGLGAGITPTPAMLDLGSHALDTTTLARAVTLSNCSAAPIAVTNARIEGTDASEFTIVAEPQSPMIAPAGFASWLIVFNAHTAGLKHATFAVDDPDGTATIELDGEGLGPTPGPATGPSSYYACSTGTGKDSWPVVLAVLAVFRTRRSSSRRPRSATPSA